MMTDTAHAVTETVTTTVVDEVDVLGLAPRTVTDARIMTVESDAIAIMAVDGTRTGGTRSQMARHSLRKTSGIAVPFSCSSLQHVCALVS
jgi:hypothetical protein